LVLLNVPPVNVPSIFRVEGPVLMVAKFTVVLTELPGLMVPSDCGSGVPGVPPSVAVVSMTLVAGNVPMFVTVIFACTVDGLVRTRVEEVTSLTPPHGEGPAVKA